ncbi:MAG: cyclase family protein [Clostridia bacterium]|nr:cyclase family protein [Clostridia bacterium]
MMIDITLRLTTERMGTAWENTAKSLVGHLGTHFDVMDKEFPLVYTKRKGVVFDVSHVRGRDVAVTDVALDRVEEGAFVAFRTAFLEEEVYGSPRYFKEHPELSQELINALLDRGVSIIGVDCAGIRRGKEHVPADQRCADRGVFVVENLDNLQAVLALDVPFTVRTYPMNITGVTGLPCRVVVETD